MKLPHAPVARALRMALLLSLCLPVLAGCGKALQNRSFGLDSRRERIIAEKVKNDPFPTAIEAGVASAR